MTSSVNIPAVPWICWVKLHKASFSMTCEDCCLCFSAADELVSL